MELVKAGDTNQSIYFYVQDAVTGGAYITTGSETDWNLIYTRKGAAQVSNNCAAALAAVDGAHEDNKIKHVGNGEWRADFPDAAFAVGVKGVELLLTEDSGLIVPAKVKVMLNGQVDIVAVSGDQTAADNFEAMLDGTGGVTLTTNLTGNITGNLTGDITGAIVGNITGNLSGSVGSVTGAVGSVTGAVGSVIGNVGGNVNGNIVGSVASLVGHTVQTADHTASIASILNDTGTAGVVVAAASKTGYALSATGLDAITATAPGGVASTFPQMLVQLWRRFFKKSTLTATELKTYADDGSTPETTQTPSDDGTTQTLGASS